MDLAGWLPPGPEPVRAWERSLEGWMWGGHLQHPLRDPREVPRDLSCTLRFNLSTPNASGACGALREDRIISETCGSALAWICQKEAVLL